MTPSEQIERLLPRLRGFARVVVADADLADECVEDAIRRLLEHPRAILNVSAASYQLHLFRLVDEALRKKAGNTFQKRAWRALVLIRVEGLTFTEASSVLAISRSEIQRLVSFAEENFESGDHEADID